MASFTGNTVLFEKDHRWPIVGWLIGLFVAYVLLASAIAHLGNPYQFLAAIRAYQLIPVLPQAGAELGATLLPFLHVTLAVCLITRCAPRSAFCVGVFLFLFYAVAQTTALARGLKVGCGCFGPSEDLIGVRSIGLAIASSLACAFGYWALRSQCRTTLPSSPPATASAGL